MRTLLLAMVLLLPVVAFSPQVASQAVAAEGCVRMYDPRDPSVNRSPSPSRAVWTFLYAAQPEHADLVLVPPAERVSTVLGPATTPAIGCYSLVWTLGDIVNLTAINAAYEGTAWSPAAPIQLASETVLLFLYVRIPQPVATVIPVRVDVKVREGLDGSNDVLASGLLEADLDGQRLWELRVPLHTGMYRWPIELGPRAGFYVDINFCITKGGMAGLGIPVEFVSGPKTPARLLLFTSETLETTDLRSIVEPDAVRVQQTVLAVFGKYDVDAANATLDLVGRHARGPWEPELVKIKRDYVQASKRSPVVLEWRINRTEFFDNTEYTIRARVTNLQGTYYTDDETTHRSLTFEGESRVPGLSAPFALLVLGSFVAWRSRRSFPARRSPR